MPVGAPEVREAMLCVVCSERGAEFVARRPVRGFGWVRLCPVCAEPAGGWALVGEGVQAGRFWMRGGGRPRRGRETAPVGKS